ncbi:MAG: lysylphosphatidylglycerol synthase transmembrane domain-containing protein [Rhodothermales bacterium]
MGNSNALSSRARTWAIRAGSFAIAAVLLWFALRNADFAAVGTALKQANWWWMPPAVVATYASHWLRAERWCLMMDKLPGQSRRTSRVVAFLSLMVGYMANYAGPRVGELIRTGNVAAHEKIPFSTLLGTVVVERVLDVVMLGLGLLMLPLIYGNELPALIDALGRPLGSVSTGTWLLLSGAALVGGGVVFWLVVLRRSSGESRLGRLIQTFRSGLLSVLRTGRTGTLIVQSVAMWACYVFMAWVPFAMLHMTDFSMLDALGIMLIGSIGVVIPAPGGIGTYHFITVQALGLLYLVPETDAATYALLTHTGQMVMYVAAGFLGILYLGNRPARS